jgi:hypothetical protein
MFLSGFAFALGKAVANLLIITGAGLAAWFWWKKKK